MPTQNLVKTRQLQFRCHYETCRKLQTVAIPQFTRLIHLDDILKKTQCLYGNHLLYSVKALQKEMK